jgi:hypothetical protein
VVGRDVDFTIREEFSGPLLPLMAGSLPAMTETFRNFVAALTARAERAWAGPWPRHRSAAQQQTAHGRPGSFVQSVP